MGKESSHPICHVPVQFSPHFLFFFLSFKCQKDPPPMHISERKSLTNMHIYTELYTVVNVSPSNVQIQAFVNYNNIVLHSLGGVVF